MIRKKTLQVLILSVAVIVVLLRPYAAYQLTSRADFAANPVEANDILKRLVKKKEGHHSTIERETKSAIALPVIHLPFNKKQISIITVVFKRQRQVNTVFHIGIKSKPYLFLSRLRV